MSRKGYFRQPGETPKNPTIESILSKRTRHARAHHATPRAELYLLQYKFPFLPLLVFGLHVLLVLGPSLVTTDLALPYIIALVLYFFTFSQNIADGRRE